MRPDLNGGVDLKGLTVHNYYQEISKGRYDLSGGVTTGSRCRTPRRGTRPTPARPACQSDQGHPDNPRGNNQIAVDALDGARQGAAELRLGVLRRRGPAATVDDDGNLFEPDGVLDHVVVVHAGSDQSDGGGAQGTYALWASSRSSTRPPAATRSRRRPAARCSTHRTSPRTPGSASSRTSSVTTSACRTSTTPIGGDRHRHRLLGPDEHRLARPAELFQHRCRRTWARGASTSSAGLDPKVLDYGEPHGDRHARPGVASRRRAPRTAVKGQPARPRWSRSGRPHSGENPGGRQRPGVGRRPPDPHDRRADGSDVRFWAGTTTSIEEDWDYGFIEVSTDGGTTWTQLEVYDEAGNVVSTDEDPNGRLADFGGLENGLTGDSGRLPPRLRRPDAVRGQTIQLRLRYATDAAFQERGWFADDFSVTDGGTTVWTDDVEGGDNGWTAEAARFTGTTGEGWMRTSGSFDFEQYYLAEWRNFDGFDKGLKYAYATRLPAATEREGRAHAVQRAGPARLVPGLALLVQRRHRPPDRPAEHRRRRARSLLVDAHYEPAARGRGGAGQPEPARQPARPPAGQRRRVRPGRPVPVPGVLPHAAPTRVLRSPATGSAGAAPVRRSPTPGPGTRASSTGPTWTRRPALLPRQRRLGRRAVEGQQIYSTRVTDKNGKPRAQPVRHRRSVTATCRHRQPGRRPAGGRRRDAGHRRGPVPRREAAVQAGDGGTAARIDVRPGHPVR